MCETLVLPFYVLPISSANYKPQACQMQAHNLAGRLLAEWINREAELWAQCGHWPDQATWSSTASACGRDRGI